VTTAGALTYFASDVKRTRPDTSAATISDTPPTVALVSASRHCGFSSSRDVDFSPTDCRTLTGEPARRRDHTSWLTKSRPKQVPVPAPQP